MVWLIFMALLAYDEALGQSPQAFPKYYSEADFAPKIESLRALYGKNLSLSLIHI